MLKGIRCGLPTGRGDLRIQCLATGLQRKENECKPRTCSQHGAVLQGPFSQVLPMVPVCFLSQHASLRAFIPTFSWLAAYTPVWWDCRGVIGASSGTMASLQVLCCRSPFPWTKACPHVAPLLLAPQHLQGNSKVPAAALEWGPHRAKGLGSPPLDSTASPGPCRQPGHQHRAGG